MLVGHSPLKIFWAASKISPHGHELQIGKAHPAFEPGRLNRVAAFSSRPRAWACVAEANAVPTAEVVLKSEASRLDWITVSALN
jgi:hypothetical protein